MPFQSSGSPAPLSPAGRALAVLMQIEDRIGEHDAVLVVRDGSLFVLVDSLSAFGMWVFELKARHEKTVHSQMHVALCTAETRVCGCPVLVCRGDFAPTQSVEAVLAA